jgi:hypothetical protein
MIDVGPLRSGLRQARAPVGRLELYRSDTMTSSEPDTETLDALGEALACWGQKFRLLCGRCDTEVRCDLKSGEYMNADTHRQAALKFWRQGWRIADLPICPTCRKERARRPERKGQP